ncbi:MAG: hypothetical protein ACRC12_00430 [Holosporales bacterium]
MNPGLKTLSDNGDNRHDLTAVKAPCLLSSGNQSQEQKDSQPTTLIFIGAKPQDQEFSKQKRLMDILFQSREHKEKVSWGYAISFLIEAGITYNKALNEYSQIRKKIKDYYNKENLRIDKNFWKKWTEISTDRNLLREILMSNHPRKKSKTLS